MVQRQPVIALVYGLFERPNGFSQGRGRRPRRSEPL